jgi:thiamine biosynthesis lipoprotein
MLQFSLKYQSNSNCLNVLLKKRMKISFYSVLFSKESPTDNHPSRDIHPLRVGLCLLFFSFFLLLFQGCRSEKEVVFSGRTMGTTYHIKGVAGYFKRTSGLQDRIDARLAAINQSMSTYIADSEISRFNRSTITNEPLHVGDDFFQVFRKAQQLHTLSGGAWDATIKPLVDLWGFGNREPGDRLPNAAIVHSTLKAVGFDHIQSPGQGEIQKKLPSVTLDFASIAKGYAVDQIALLLIDAGIGDFIVEIGGEVFASGVRQDGEKWRVGINLPDKQASLQDLYSVVRLSNRAMATSGDYRNFIERDGVVYSHIIDPRTGYPIQNNVASVTITAPDCTMADGLATAVVVMGMQKGKALIETLPGIEGLIIVRDPDGTLRDFPSSGFVTLSE